MLDLPYEDNSDDTERFKRLARDVADYEMDVGRDAFSAMLLGALDVEVAQVMYADYPPVGHGYPRREMP